MVGRMDVDDARDLAWVFLHRDRPRWVRVEAVAERAWQLRCAVPPSDRDLLVAAAWLLDLGHSPVLQVTGFPPLDGGRYLATEGHPQEGALVVHQSGARFVAAALGLAERMERYPFAETPVTDVLTYVDQTTGPAGHRITVTERLAEALSAPGPVPVGSRRGPYVLAAAARVEQRLQILRAQAG